MICREKKFLGLLNPFPSLKNRSIDTLFRETSPSGDVILRLTSADAELLARHWDKIREHRHVMEKVPYVNLMCQVTEALDKALKQAPPVGETPF